MWLFFLFVAVPIIEIALFIQVGGAIGLWPTLLIVVLTAFAGTALMRSQGLAALARVQDDLGSGNDPSATLVEGALILVAGVLLLTPGFFTDALGLALLFPPSRKWLMALGAKAVLSRVRIVTPGTSRSGFDRGPTIDGDYRVIDPDDR